MCKLNGGLGTSMGLDKAKSLLEVQGGNTFLDIIALQGFDLRKRLAGGIEASRSLCVIFGTLSQVNNYKLSPVFIYDQDPPSCL